MTEMPLKSAAQLAREVIGHEEGCIGDCGIPGECTCPEPPLHMLVAAAEGTLKNMDWRGTSPGSCEYPPLDAAKAWEKYVACQVAKARSGEGAGLVERRWDARPRMLTDEEWRRFWAETWLALRDAGLIPGPKDP